MPEYRIEPFIYHENGEVKRWWFEDRTGICVHGEGAETVQECIAMLPSEHQLRLDPDLDGE
jgi:hypothetical protein